MTHVFRHYRHVKIVDSSDSITPEVLGVEEIYRNGQRQVRYWGDRPSHRFAPEDNTEQTNDWTRPTYARRAPRYTPFEVVDPVSQPSPFGSQPPRNERWNTAQHKLIVGVQKLKSMAKSVPSALKAAWRELNR